MFFISLNFWENFSYKIPIEIQKTTFSKKLWKSKFSIYNKNSQTKFSEKRLKHTFSCKISKINFKLNNFLVVKTHALRLIELTKPPLSFNFRSPNSPDRNANHFCKYLVRGWLFFCAQPLSFEVLFSRACKPDLLKSSWKSV